MVIEQYMYDAFKRNEERVQQLHRMLDAGEATGKIIRLIFDWPAPQEEPKAVPLPPLPETQADPIVVPPPKPLKSKKPEMMAKVKDMKVNHDMSRKEIAKATGLSVSTVDTYLKEQGLVGEASMTLLEGAHGGQMK